jgi:hypothetical protein
MVILAATCVAIGVAPLLPLSGIFQQLPPARRGTGRFAISSTVESSYGRFPALRSADYGRNCDPCKLATGTFSWGSL